MIGNTYTIRWNSSGISGPVGIKLFQNGSSLGYIAQDVPNTGSYEWPIDSIIGVGPIRAGEHYQIQVKKSGVAAGLSGEFTISERETRTRPGTINPLYRALKDLEIKEIKYVEDRGGWLVAKIKNYYNVINRNVKFKILLLDRDMLEIHPYILTKHLNLNVGEEKTVYLIQKSSLGEVPFCGERVKVIVDPDNEIRETKENNNYLIRRIKTKTVDLAISITKVIFKRIYLHPRYRWKLIFKVKVRARGTGYESLSNVSVFWRMCKHGEDITRRSIFYRDIARNVSIRRGEEKEFTVNVPIQNANKKRHSGIFLKPGYDYDVYVEVDTPEKLCEINKHNNTRIFTISPR